ncbi:hypothetical protein KJ652_06435 [Patescibacteria group bacterium]|nr:hypothetical protein [Patescibacteria group bacterium]
MTKQPTTIRLDPRLYKQVLREAKKSGLSFTGIVHLLLQAFVAGEVQVGVTQYPKEYVENLEKESAELSRLYKEGKAKGYTSSKALFNDILGA